MVHVTTVGFDHCSTVGSERIPPLIMARIPEFPGSLSRWPGTMFSLDQAILTWDPLVLVRTMAERCVRTIVGPKQGRYQPENWGILQ